MTTCITYVLVLLSTIYVTNVKCNLGKSALYENQYLQTENRNDFAPYTFYDESGSVIWSISQVVQQITPDILKAKTLLPKFIGGKNKTVIYIGIRESNPSDVIISYDYGYKFQNKTEQFKLSNGHHSKVDQVYIHPEFKDSMIFVDTTNKVIFSTTDSGGNIARTEIEFTPNSITYHDTNKNHLFAIDNNNDNQLWYSDNFGSNWKNIQHKTIRAFWPSYKELDEQLFVTFVNEYSGMALYSSDMYKNTATIIGINVKSIFQRNKYVFYIKQIDDSGNCDLYISNTPGETMKGHFDTELNNKYFRIVEITDDDKIFAIVHHSNEISHLYVSENVEDGVVYFSLILKNIYSYVPGFTTDTYGLSKEFDEFYKVEGVTGVYIASTVYVLEQYDILYPSRLISVITFDSGKTWTKITMPNYDVNNKKIDCPGCSLNLFQNTDTNKSPILSRKSTPGIIIATGRIDKSFSKDDSADFFVSRDAGYTWRQSKLGSHRYQIGNYGDLLLTMKRDDKGQVTTQSLSASNDYGKTWNSVTIYNKDVLVNTFVKTPDEMNTTYTVIGVINKKRDHIVNFKLDFASFTSYDCKEDVWTTWVANHKYLPKKLAEEIAKQRHHLKGDYCFSWG